MQQADPQWSEKALRGRGRERALAADSNQTISASQPHRQGNVIVGDFVDATKVVSFMTSVLRKHLT